MSEIIMLSSFFDIIMYLSTHFQQSFGEAHLFANKGKPMPFVVMARKWGERYEGPSFISPCVNK